MKVSKNLETYKKELLLKLKPFWKEFKKLQSKHNKELMKLEAKMKKEIGDEDIEFAYVEGECFGIGFGQFSPKNETIGVFHDRELEDEMELHWAIRLRKRLLIRGTHKWNAWVRDLTAWLEVHL